MNLITVTSTDASILRRPTKKFYFERRLDGTYHRMVKIMGEHTGCGLAATQVGISERFFIGDIDGETKLIINPRITKTWGLYVNTEGCLSIPGKVFHVPRYRSIEVQYQDALGELHTYSTNCEKTSAIFQHEIDHLDGILIDDYCTHKSKKCYCNYVKHRQPLAVEDIMRARELKEKLSFGDLYEKVYEKYLKSYKLDLPKSV